MFTDFLDAVDGANVGMIQSRHCLRFFHQLSLGPVVADKLRGKKLERYLPFQSRVLCEVNFSHAASTETPQNPVRSDLFALEPGAQAIAHEVHSQIKSGFLDKSLGALVGSYQRLDLVTERFVAIASRGEIGTPVRRREVQSRMEEVLNPVGIFILHRSDELVC